jgi:putative protease
MSAKDLCVLPFVEEMKKAGISSFKIEGRNRSPEYVYTVVSEYRKALDKKLSRGEIVDGINNLRKVYNRGFSVGFYFGIPTADDFSWSENGEQSEKKEFVGKVFKYWPRAGVCSVKINAGRLKVGDEVYLIGSNIGAERVVVKSIEFEGKGVDVAKKGQEVGVDFGVKAGSGTEVYLIRKS